MQSGNTVVVLLATRCCSLKHSKLRADLSANWPEPLKLRANLEVDWMAYAVLKADLSDN